MHRSRLSGRPFVHRQARRLRQNRLQWRYERRFSPVYPRLSWLGNAVRLRANLNRYAMLRQGRSTRDTVSILGFIFRTTAGQVLLALVVVAILKMAEHSLSAPISTGVKLWPTPPVAHILHIRSFPVAIDGPTYASIMGTIAQIAGIFLGLYFTAISVVLSTAYARVPGNLRLLVVRDKIGNLYVKAIALLGVVSLVALGLHAIGRPPSLLLLLCVTALGGYGIISFVALGLRVFFLFDPTTLVGYLVRDLQRCIDAATPQGFRWQDRIFQGANHGQARDLLATFGMISRLSATTPDDHLAQVTDVQRANAISVGQSVLALLRSYAPCKSRIPRDSLWFKPTLRHRDWLTTNETYVNIVLRMGSNLDPEIVPDHLWFEAEVGQIVARSLGTILGNDNADDLAALGVDLQMTMTVLGGRLAVTEALDLFRRLRPLVLSRLYEGGGDQNNAMDDGQQLAFLLALADIYGLLLNSLMASMIRRIGALTADSFYASIARVAWERPDAIYATDCPAAVVTSLEALKKGLDFERAVEGRIVTPMWYLQQNAALGLVQFLSQSLDDFLAEIDTTFVQGAKELVARKRYPVIVQVVQRGLEAINRCRLLSRDIKRCYDALGALRRGVDTRWIRIDVDGGEMKLASAHEELVVALAEASDGLDAMPSSRQWPDYAGLAHLTLAAECYAAMASDNGLLFQRIFPAFFRSCWTAQQRLRLRLEDDNDQAKALFNAVPMINLLELSGYAFIYSAFTGKPYWFVTKELWDQYLDGNELRETLVESLSATVEYRATLLRTLPGDQRRVEWKRTLEQRLAERGALRADTQPVASAHQASTSILETNFVIRALTRKGSVEHIYDDALDVFFVVYVMERPETKSNVRVRLPRHAQGFAKAWERERSATHGEPS